MSVRNSPASMHHGPVTHPQIVCLATAEMLPQARVMARSLRRHEPDWGLELVLIGSATAARAHEDELPIVSVEQELELDAEELLARHKPGELTALLVPRLLLARVRSGTGPTIHLPASSWILDELSPWCPRRTITRSCWPRGRRETPRLTGWSRRSGSSSAPGGSPPISWPSMDRRGRLAS